MNAFIFINWDAPASQSIEDLKIISFIFASDLARLSESFHDRLFAINSGHGGNASSGNMREFTLSSPNNAQMPLGILEKDLRCDQA